MGISVSGGVKIPQGKFSVGATPQTGWDGYDGTLNGAETAATDYDNGPAKGALAVLSSTKAVYVFQGVVNRGQARTLNMSDTTISSVGSAQTYIVGTASNNDVDTIDSTRVIIAYRDSSASNQLSLIVGTVSGDTISFGTVANVETSSFSNHVTMLSSTQGVIIYLNQTSGTVYNVVAFTVSGSTITLGSSTTIYTSPGGATGVADPVQIVNIDSTHALVVYTERSVAIDDKHLNARVITVSGTTVSDIGTETEIINDYSSDSPTVARLSASDFVFATKVDRANTDVKARLLNVSGTTVSLVDTSDTISSFPISAVPIGSADSTHAMIFGFGTSVEHAVARIVSGVSIEILSDVIMNNSNSFSNGHVVSIDSTRMLVGWIENAQIIKTLE